MNSGGRKARFWCNLFFLYVLGGALGLEFFLTNWGLAAQRRGWKRDVPIRDLPYLTIRGSYYFPILLGWLERVYVITGNRNRN